MSKQFLALVLIVTTFFVIAVAQSSDTSSRPRSANANQSKDTTASPPSGQEKSAASPQPTDTGSAAVVEAFNKLRDGIQKADVDLVTSVYWKSPGLILFNNNGTVTKGWEQLRKNRESSYPEIKDVKLEVRDVSVVMLGREGAVLNCLWTQSQTYKGASETASGRMTLVFKKIGKDWKAVHLHTSPDKEDPSRVLPSERETPTPGPPPPPEE